MRFGIRVECLQMATSEFCSQRWLEYTGTSLDEVRGEELAAAIHPQTNPILWRVASGHHAGRAIRSRARCGVPTELSLVLDSAVPLPKQGGISRWYGTRRH